MNFPVFLVMGNIHQRLWGRITAMSNEQEYLPKIAMSIVAHPDDQDFTIAGTLAKWAKAGCRVVSVLITSGDSGSNDIAHDAEHKPALAKVREAEQEAANALLGIAETVFLRYPDGELVPSLALRKDLTRLIRKYKPDVVVTGDPSARFYGNEYINHPDHRAAAEAATYAVFPSAGTRLIFTDLLEAGYEPHNVKRLYIHGVGKIRYVGGYPRDHRHQDRSLEETHQPGGHPRSRSMDARLGKRGRQGERTSNLPKPIE